MKKSPFACELYQYPYCLYLIGDFESYSYEIYSSTAAKR
jgi:hypothetical protein